MPVKSKTAAEESRMEKSAAARPKRTVARPAESADDSDIQEVTVTKKKEGERPRPCATNVSPSLI